MDDISERIFVPTALENSMSKWQKYYYSSLLLVIVVLAGMCFSLQAPIYPYEAEMKGIPPSQYGFVFGVFQLVVFITSPFYGAYAKTIGATFLFNAGVFISSWCTVLFGFLDRSPPGMTFLSLSIAIRSVCGFGDAAVYTSCLILAIGLYPDSIATAMGAVETSFGIGVIVGPTVGGLLYDFGGFSLPFFVIGGILVLLCFVSIFSFKESNADEIENTGERPKILKVLRNPFILIACFSIFSASAAIGFVQALLEPHLRSLDLSKSSLGLVYMAMGVAYALSSVVGGRVADKIGHFNVSSIIGLVISSLGLIFLGPAPFLPLHVTIGLIVPAVLVIGFGLGFVLINSVMELLRITTGDSPKNRAAEGFVSGLYNCVFALGSFVGPTAGGPLFDLMGFSMASMVMLGLEILAMILVFGVVLRKFILRRRKQQPVRF